MVGEAKKLGLKSHYSHYVITKMNMTTKLMLVMHCEDVSGISFMAGEQHSGGRAGQFIITRPLFWPCIGKRWNIEIKSKSCRFWGRGDNNIKITATARCICRVSRYLRYRGYEDKKTVALTTRIEEPWKLHEQSPKCHFADCGVLVLKGVWMARDVLKRSGGWHGMEEKVADQRPFPSHLPPLPFTTLHLHST